MLHSRLQKGEYYYLYSIYFSIYSIEGWSAIRPSSSMARDLGPRRRIERFNGNDNGNYLEYIKSKLGTIYYYYYINEQRLILRCDIKKKTAVFCIKSSFCGRDVTVFSRGVLFLSTAPRFVPMFVRDLNVCYTVALIYDPLVSVCACRFQTDRSGEVSRRLAELTAEASSGFPASALHLSQVCAYLPHLRRHESALPARVCRSASFQVSALRHAQQIYASGVQAHSDEAS